MFSGMSETNPGNLNTDLNHSYLWKKRGLRYTITKLLSRVRPDQNKQTLAAFETWKRIVILNLRKSNRQKTVKYKLHFLTTMTIKSIALISLMVRKAER